MIESVLPHNLIVLLAASVLLAGIVQGALMVRRAFTNQRLLQERIAELQAVVDDVHERYNKTLGQLAETTRLAREREERDKRRIGELETLTQELRGRIEELERRLPGDDFGELSRAGQRLAVLGIWPDVAKLPPLNAAGEAAAIYNAGFNYRALQDKEATRLNILRELRRHSYGVIEVGAHGNSEGIMLSDGLAEPRWWADVLHGHRVRLVVLMACESDLVGDALVRAGMPAVVSVQRKIPDRDAVLFVTALYEGLAAASTSSAAGGSTGSASASSATGGGGMAVEEAVARARLAVPRASAEMIRFRQGSGVGG